MRTISSHFKTTVWILLITFIVCLIVVRTSFRFLDRVLPEQITPSVIESYGFAQEEDQNDQQQQRNQQQDKQQNEQGLQHTAGQNDTLEERNGDGTWTWKLDEIQLQTCLERKRTTIDIYSTGRSHEKDRPFPIFVPSFSPNSWDMIESNNSTIPMYSSPEAEQMVSCLLDLNKKSLEDLTKALSIHYRINPQQSNHAIVPIVIICHKRDNYLRHCIQSIIANIGIEETIIIFSHDGYFPSVQQVIQDIMEEAKTKGLNIRYVQFFFPFSRSWLSHSFFLHLPFFDTALARHHYYWMWNYMFDVVLPSHDIFQWTDDDMYVSVMEEDQVVASDFYQVIKVMLEVVKPLQEQDPVFVYTSGLASERPYIDPNKLDAFQYDTVQNAGLTLSRTMFRKVRNGGKPDETSQHFSQSDTTTTWCNFNEYNWDWTIYRMTQQYVPGTSIVPAVKRIAHIGSCGMHFKGSSCDELIANIQEQFLIPIDTYIRNHPSSPMNLGLFFTHPDNYTNPDTIQKRQEYYKRPEKSLTSVHGRRPDTRSRPIHGGFKGWMNGVLSPEYKAAKIQSDEMVESDDLTWYSPFNELLCKRIEVMYSNEEHDQ